VQIREILDGIQHTRVLVSQKAPAFCQRLGVQRQGQVLVAHGTVQTREIADGGERVWVIVATKKGYNIILLLYPYAFLRVNVLLD
jgi:hypothetical protein